MLDQVRVFEKELSSSQVSTLYAETAATVESLDPLNVDTTDTLQVLGDSSCIATYQFEMYYYQFVLQTYKNHLQMLF